MNNPANHRRIDWAAVLVTIAICLFILYRTATNFGPIDEYDERIATATSALRDIAIGLEVYAADKTTFPPHPADETIPPILTSPIAYLNRLPPDPFAPGKAKSPYHYYASPRRDGWVAYFAGRDRDYDLNAKILDRLYDPQTEDWNTLRHYLYDPTNGINSSGDFIRTGKTIY